jgi:hypothetical protein
MGSPLNPYVSHESLSKIGYFVRIIFIGIPFRTLENMSPTNNHSHRNDLLTKGYRANSRMTKTQNVTGTNQGRCSLEQFSLP